MLYWHIVTRRHAIVSPPPHNRRRASISTSLPPRKYSANIVLIFIASRPHIHCRYPRNTRLPVIAIARGGFTAPLFARVFKLFFRSGFFSVLSPPTPLTPVSRPTWRLRWRRRRRRRGAVCAAGGVDARAAHTVDGKTVLFRGWPEFLVF